MNARFVLTTTLGLVLGTAGSVTAQSSRIEIAPTAGYMIFGDILRGPLGTSLSNANGAVFGAQVMLPVGGPVAFYLNGAYAKSEMQVGVPVLGALSVGNTDAWMADGGIELRAGTAGVTRPFVQLGVGAAHYEIRTPVLNTGSTNLVFAAGAGLDVPVAPGLGLRLMARDQFGTFDFRDVTGIGIEGRTAHNVSFGVGLRISL